MGLPIAKLKAEAQWNAQKFFLQAITCCFVTCYENLDNSIGSRFEVSWS